MILVCREHIFYKKNMKHNSNNTTQTTETCLLGHRASHSHCWNVRHSIARCADERASQELRKLLGPERRHEYLIQTIQYDESTYRLVPHLGKAAPVPVQNAHTSFNVRAAAAEIPFTYSLPLKLGFMTSKYRFIMNSV